MIGFIRCAWQGRQDKHKAQLKWIEERQLQDTTKIPRRVGIALLNGLCFSTCSILLGSCLYGICQTQVLQNQWGVNIDIY